MKGDLGLVLSQRTTVAKRPTRGVMRDASDEVAIWLVFTLAVSVTPFIFAYLQFPSAQGINDVLGRGDAFIASTALLSAEFPRLFNRRAATGVGATLLAGAFILSMLYCVWLYAQVSAARIFVDSQHNIAVGPNASFNEEAVTRMSLVSLVVAALLSIFSIYLQHRTAIPARPLRRRPGR